jgi:uncharacterized membrane-anchored protein
MDYERLRKITMDYKRLRWITILITKNLGFQRRDFICLLFGHAFFIGSYQSYRKEQLTRMIFLLAWKLRKITMDYERLRWITILITKNLGFQRRDFIW